jgi:hypothetical protein
MGTKLTVTREDVVATALLTPGWYKCICNTYEEKPSKGDASLNRNLGFLVKEGESEGVKLRTTFNEKFAPLLGDFINAVGGEFKEGNSYDLEDAFTAKKEVLIHVKRGEYNGKPTNEIDGFRAV